MSGRTATAAPAVAGLCWAALVLLGAWRRRPPPARVRRLLTDASGLLAPGGPSRGRSHPVAAVTERVGRVALRVAAAAVARAPPPHPGSSPAPDADMARRVGGAVLAAVAGALVAPFAALPAAVVAWGLPAVRRRRESRRRAAAIAAAVPEAVELLAVAVTAGLTVPHAVAAAADRLAGPLGVELRRVTAEVAMGRRFGDALEALPGRAGDVVRPVVAALLASERYGAPLSAALDRLAAEARLQRRRAAEEAARRVPVLLLFPLVLCILPAFVLLTVVPLLAGAAQSLRW